MIIEGSLNRYEKLTGKTAEIQRKKDDRAPRTKKCSLFMRMLTEREECIEFDPALFIGVIEKVVVSGMKKIIWIRFVLGNGSKSAISGTEQQP